MPIPAAAALLIAAAVAGAIVAARRRSRVTLTATSTGAPRPAAASGTLPPITMPPDLAGLVNREIFENFPPWVARWEGVLSTMYRDVIGLVTTGVGNMIDDTHGQITAEGLALPWLRSDGSRATPEDIRAEWARVKALPAGRAFAAGSFRAPAELHLEPAGIAALVGSHLAGDVRAVAKTFPSFPAFPPSAQHAVLDIAWGRGAFCWPKYPELARAIQAQNWRAAAAAVGDPAARAARTEARADLFRRAAG